MQLPYGMFFVSAALGVGSGGCLQDLHAEMEQKDSTRCCGFSEDWELIKAMAFIDELLAIP